MHVLLAKYATQVHVKELLHVVLLVMMEKYVCLVHVNVEIMLPVQILKFVLMETVLNNVHLLVQLEKHVIEEYVNAVW